jgi:hypothetical protein
LFFSFLKNLEERCSVVKILEERFCHLKSPGRRLSSDDLQNHFPTIDANGLQRSLQTFANQIAVGFFRSEKKLRKIAFKQKRSLFRVIIFLLLKEKVLQRFS